MKKIISILLFVCVAVGTFAQNGPTVSRVHYSDTTWHDRGFDVYIGAGMFIGNKYNATQKKNSILELNA